MRLRKLRKIMDSANPKAIYSLEKSRLIQKMEAEKPVQDKAGTESSSSARVPSSNQSLSLLDKNANTLEKLVNQLQKLTEVNMNGHPAPEPSVLNPSDPCLIPESEMQDETMQKELEDKQEKLGLRIKCHEDNLKFLQSEIKHLDDCILDMEVELQNYHSSSESDAVNQNLARSKQKAIELMLRQEKTEAGLICQLKLRNGTLASELPLSKDVLGIVATLGRVDDDNLGRLLSEYIGLETMLAVVCKTFEGVKALEMYDNKGLIDKNADLHQLSIGKPVNGRFVVVCLEDIRPYIGAIREDVQKSLALPKPKLPSGECPAGFLGFAVNMINLDSRHLSFVTASGHGLRETLFYSLFSRLQVYRNREEMQHSRPYIADGAISLDGGIMKGNGFFFLGRSKDLEVTFPVSSGISDVPVNVTETEEKLRLTKWEKEKIAEDMQREQSLLQHAKRNFYFKKTKFMKFLPENLPSEPESSKDLEVTFPLSSGTSDMPIDITKTEEKVRLTTWETKKNTEDMQREQSSSQHTKKNSDLTKTKVVKFLPEISPSEPQISDEFVGGKELLAPGFRFHPTDEELVSYYLKRKVIGKPLRLDAISVIDLYKSEPWDLPGQSRPRTQDREWYFFSALDKKYENGSRTNRATKRGYWKTTGKDRTVRWNSQTVGMKKTLVFYIGRAPRGERTNWVMHEYRLEDEELGQAGIAQDAFVLCKVFQKSGSGLKIGEQ